jgi:hypothetical protein
VKPLGEVVADHTPRLMALAGVVGIAEGLDRGQPCVLILVEALSPQLRRSLPKSLDGYRVKVQPTGELRARK